MLLTAHKFNYSLIEQSIEEKHQFDLSELIDFSIIMSAQEDCRTINQYYNCVINT